jgi:sporulation protein YlmC with PRC-barrel domain
MDFTQDARVRTAAGDDVGRVVYAYVPYGVLYVGYGYGPVMMSDVAAKTVTNIPENEVALKQGANVMSRDGEHVGDVDQVLTDPNTNRASHFVISQGLLFKSRKLIPIAWVTRVGENEVHLAVSSRTLERTMDYEK